MGRILSGGGAAAAAALFIVANFFHFAAINAEPIGSSIYYVNLIKYYYLGNRFVVVVVALVQALRSNATTTYFALHEYIEIMCIIPAPMSEQHKKKKTPPKWVSGMKQKR